MHKAESKVCAAGLIGVLAQVDTMIVQAIGLLDDLDKELNTYAMRVREWYGWHFPEMTRIVTDNITYAKVVRAPWCLSHDGLYLWRFWLSISCLLHAD